MGRDKKIFLLDSMALIYRAYFAFSQNPRVSSKGLNTSAMYGFTNTLLELLLKEKPTHIAIVFDTHAPTVRHEIHTEYKANREETPEDIIKSVPYIIKIAQAFRIPVLMKDGYEADDIIGTLAINADKQGFEVYMMTSDKDYGQLVNEHIHIYKPSNKGKPPEVLGVKEVCAKFEIQEPRQVIDILGLMGDAVDNIKGIPGVGEKTAIQLIKDFGSVENLLQHTAELKGKLKEKVEQNKELALQSKQLATIITDVPVEYSFAEMALQLPDKQQLLDIFSELEFKTITARVLKEYFSEQDALPAGETVSGAASNPSPEIGSSIHTLSGTNETDKFLEDIAKAPEAAFYMHLQNDGCQAIAISVKAEEVYYIPLGHNGLPPEEMLSRLGPFFQNKDTVKIGHDIKQALKFLSACNISLEGELFDTMIAHFLVHPESGHSIPDMASVLLSLHIDEFGNEGRRGAKGQTAMFMVSEDQLKALCCQRAGVLLRIHGLLKSKMNEMQVGRLFSEVEIPLLKVLSDMETAGIRVNPGTLGEISVTLQSDIEGLRREIQSLAGQEFNIDSPRQVGEILFDKLKISDNVKKTKTGQYSTGEETLTELAGDNPIVQKILDYRELQKLKNTYVDSLPHLIDPKTGRIHTTFNQVVAVTGRLSSDNPNLQNIPIRTERGREVRKAFIAGEGRILLSADYSQIELRIIASLSGDAAMIEAFRNKTDVHAATAARLYNVPVPDVTPEMRRNAKTVNFGIVYGISGFGLSQRLGIARKEALEIIKQYFMQYPGLKEYMDRSIAFAKEHGYVQTIMGRRRYLPDINSRNGAVRGFAERNAINAPVQGSAADMIKIAMIQVHNEMKSRRMGSRMILQVHDELVFDVLPHELEDLKLLVELKMKNALPLQVPVEVNMGTGNNWLEAH
ncbi:MAG: DNA polymerase I [Bacteroidia bacterium]|nr:DNA polymerase I [Bacteroidia bacterium]